MVSTGVWSTNPHSTVSLFFPQKIIGVVVTVSQSAKTIKTQFCGCSPDWSVKRDYTLLIACFSLNVTSPSSSETSEQNWSLTGLARKKSNTTHMSYNNFSDVRKLAWGAASSLCWKSTISPALAGRLRTCQRFRNTTFPTTDDLLTGRVWLWKGAGKRGHYLGDNSLAAAPGIVEALNEECQKLPPDQLPAGDDPGSFPAQDGVLVWLCRDINPAYSLSSLAYVKELPSMLCTSANGLHQHDSTIKSATPLANSFRLISHVSKQDALVFMSG